MHGILKALGYGISGIGYLTFAVSGVWGFIIEMQIVHHVWGFFGVVIGLMAAPIVLAAAPFYAILQWGNWFPLAVVYGGGVAAWSLIMGGGFVLSLADRHEPTPTP